ncbi:right-handed parallel beta-helix repeat-containing protein [candidate division KSB1 bacterium]
MKSYKLILVFSVIAIFCVFNSHLFAQQRHKADVIRDNQIPEDILKTSSTEDLLEECFKFPYLIDFFLVENIPAIFPFMIEDYNGFDELLNNRKDAGNILLNELRNMKIDEIRKREYMPRNTIKMRFDIITYFLTYDNIMKQLSGKENEVIDIFIERYEQIRGFDREKSSVFFNNMAHSFIGYAIFKYLEKIEPAKTSSLLAGNHYLNESISNFHCLSIDKDFANGIYELAKNKGTGLEKTSFEIEKLSKAATTSNYNETPNGKALANINQTGHILPHSDPDEIEDYIQDTYGILSQNNFIRITVEPTLAYSNFFNCHFYAWNNEQGYGDWSQIYDIWKGSKPDSLEWLNSPLDYYYDGGWANPADATNHKSYVTCSEAEAEIIVYKSGGSITHSGRAIEINEYNWVQSKWAFTGVYIHWPNDVPSSYGSVTTYYKLNPNYRPVGDDSDRYSSINDAISGAPGGSVISVFPGTYSNQSDIHLTTDREIRFLKVDSDTVLIKFSSGAELESWSPIYADNAGFQGQSTGNDYWDGIDIYYQDDVDIQNCTIQNAEKGIYTYEVDDAIIKYNAILDCGYGIHMVYGSDNIVENNTFTNCDDYGTLFDGSDGTFKNNTINNDKYGLKSIFNPYPGSGDVTTNTISGGTECVLTDGASNGMNIEDCELSNASLSLIYNGTTGEGTASNYNEFTKLSTGIHINNNNSGYTYDATVNYWDDTPDNLGTVSCADWEYIPKVVIINTDLEAKQKFKDAVELKRQNKHDSALGIFQNIVNDYKDSPVARKALNEISGIFSTETEAEKNAIAYYNSIYNNPNRNLSAHAARYLLFWLRRDRQYDEAEKIYDELILNRKSDEDIFDLLLNKGRMYYYDLDKKEEGILLFQQAAGIECSVNQHVIDQLNHIGVPVNPQPLPKSQYTANEETGGVVSPVTFSLNQNYPNPFNPVTSIKYQLPKASHVTLTVYNIIGQEVARLVDTDMPAGFHSVRWDASRVASGTYIYKIVAGEFTTVKKMVVIK